MTFSGLAAVAYVALWLIVIVQTVVLLEMLRQIGILRRRVGPEPGALLTGGGLPRGTAAPAFAATDLQTEQVVTLEQFRGHRVLLVFLSGGCQACRTLAPDLGLFAQEHAGEIATLAVCSGSNDGCAGFAREYRLSLPVLLDPEHRIAGAYEARVTPCATLIDAEGRVLIHGVPNSADHLEGLLQEEGTPMADPAWVKQEEVVPMRARA